MKHAEHLVEQENYSAPIDIYNDIPSAGIRNTNFQNGLLAKVYTLMRLGMPDEASCVE